jgi:hypothetical protein
MGSPARSAFETRYEQMFPTLDAAVSGSGVSLDEKGLIHAYLARERVRAHVQRSAP